MERLRKTTDAEIEAQIANDPDFSEDWNWGEAVLVIPPKKKAISIRVDEDVLDYFKEQGAGYQRRMNAVLRSYMQQKRKKRA
ncbi:MAG: BrnA antitoxin family protein [Xanthobacteraceae bacterium]